MGDDWQLAALDMAQGCFDKRFVVIGGSGFLRSFGIAELGLSALAAPRIIGCPNANSTVGTF